MPPTLAPATLTPTPIAPKPAPLAWAPASSMSPDDSGFGMELVGVTLFACDSSSTS